MTVKDLSYWGIFKISLIVDFLLPLLLAPFFILYYFVAPEKFTLNLDSKFEMYGMTFDFDTGIMNIPLAVIFALIGLLIQCAILYFLAQKTPFGRIKLGKQ